MLNNVNTNVEHIIAKIDNDFNPDNSDWIPRVAAWCIDAMSQLDVLRTVRKKKKLTVKDRIAYSECPIDNANIKVYDENGCEVVKADNNGCCNNSPSTGEETNKTSNISDELTPLTVDVVYNKVAEPSNVFAETVNDKYPFRYNIHNYSVGNINREKRNYVLINCDKIEINFDADYIYVETEYIETVYSEYFDYNLPVIPNNGILIEAIAYYCIYKMLCRGYKHPVFNLNASQYGTNPYYMWNTLKEEARRSVINHSNGNGSELFRSALFIDTFNPRN